MMTQRILFTALAAAALATPAMIAPAIFTPASAQASLNIGLSVPGPAVPFYGVAPGPAYASGYGYNRWEHREWEHRRWHEWDRHHYYDHHWR